MEDSASLELLPGVQAKLEVPELRPVPPRIQAITEKSFRRRATEVWDAAQRLEGLIRIWAHFLVLLDRCRRLEEETDDRIRARFPAVRNVGAVLNAFAEEAERGVQFGPEVDEFCRLCQIRRGPTARYQGKDNRQFRVRVW